MNPQKIAVTHASSLLAQSLLAMMASSGIDPDSVVLLDVEEQAGNRLAYGKTHITALDQQAYDYEDLLAVLLLEQDDGLEDLLQHAECYVVSHYDDDSSDVHFFAELKDIDDLPAAPASIKMASAELSTLASILRPLERGGIELKSLQVVNVLSASRWGQPGVDELASQTIDLLNGRNVSANRFPMQIAFNMIPQTVAGKEASRLAALLGIPGLNCTMQNILVPAFYGLCIAVALESREDMDVKALKEQLGSLAWITLADDIVSPYTECNKDNKSIIFGLNHPQNDTKRLQFWIITDSVRNGLINNYRNLMDFLLNSHL